MLFSSKNQVLQWVKFLLVRLQGYTESQEWMKKVKSFWIKHLVEELYATTVLN